MPDSDDSLNTFVVNLDLSLDKLDLEIVPFVNGRTGDQVYILVRSSCYYPFFHLYRAEVFTAQANRKGDEIAQVTSDDSPAELAYFKVLCVSAASLPHPRYPSDAPMSTPGLDDYHSN